MPATTNFACLAKVRLALSTLNELNHYLLMKPDVTKMGQLANLANLPSVVENTVLASDVQ